MQCTLVYMKKNAVPLGMMVMVLAAAIEHPQATYANRMSKTTCKIIDIIYVVYYFLFRLLLLFLFCYSFFDDRMYFSMLQLVMLLLR